MPVQKHPSEKTWIIQKPLKSVFYATEDFIETCFQTDYNFNFNYNFMQWYGVETNKYDRRGKLIFTLGEQVPSRHY